MRIIFRKTNYDLWYVKMFSLIVKKYCLAPNLLTRFPKTKIN